MVYKTLNNWVAKAFITELSKKHYKSCIYIYMNNYKLLTTKCWERLLWYFFNISTIEDVKKDIKGNQLLFVNFECMIADFKDSIEL